MKFTKMLIIPAATFFAAVTASFADVTINITGATAFRAAAHTSIIATLGGEGNVQIAYQGGSASGASHAIYVSQPDAVSGIDGVVTVRTSWSGSAAGIDALANNKDVSFLKTDVPVATTPVENTNGAGDREVAKAQFAFSDVEQASTPTPAPAIANGVPVGVIPFLFVASESAPEGISNITDQQFIQLFGGGFVPASLFTGDQADEDLILATGRNNESGTRITALAETGFGINTPVQQYTATVTDGVIGAPALFPPDATTELEGNSGFSSGGNLAVLLGGESSGYSFIGYVGLSDATNALGNGAKWLSYNGVPFSKEGVLNGSYTFWGYEWVYSLDLAGDADQFRNLFLAAIPDNLGGAGYRIDELNVTRLGDGGPVQPN